MCCRSWVSCCGDENLYDNEGVEDVDQISHNEGIERFWDHAYLCWIRKTSDHYKNIALHALLWQCLGTGGGKAQTQVPIIYLLKK